METTLHWKEFAKSKPDGRQTACLIAGREIIKNISIKSIQASDWQPAYDRFEAENFEVLYWAYFPTIKDFPF